MASLSVIISSAILTLFLGAVIASLTSKIIKRIIRESKTHKIVNRRLGRNLNVDIYISGLAKYVIYAFTLLIVLKQMGVAAGQLRVAIFVVLIVLVIMILLAFKEVIPSALFGLYLLQSKKIKAGTTIDINGVKGKVVEINLVETKIMTTKNEEISIPNVSILKYRRG